MHYVEFYVPRMGPMCECMILHAFANAGLAHVSPGILDGCMSYAVACCLHLFGSVQAVAIECADHTP